MIFRLIRLTFFSLLLVIAGSSLAFAAGTVGTGTPGSCTEAALDAALVGGGMVDFDCGGAAHTITLTGTKNITAATTIDGGGLISLDGNNSVSHFFTTADLTLENITIENGDNNAGNGGAVHMDSGFLQINDSVFQNNTAANSGAIYTNGGGIGIVDSTFTGNSATNNGGVLYLVGSGSLIGSGSTFEQNSADNGGVFYVAAGTLGVQESSFDMNSAGTDAGVVYVQSGQATLLDSLVTRTSAGFVTRVAYVAGAGTLNLTRTVLENNTDANTFQSMVQALGGGQVNIERVAMVNNVGAQVDSAGTVVITNSTFGDNDVVFTSGTLRFFAGTAELNNVTVVNNTSRGLYTQGTGTVDVLNSVISNNGTFDCTDGNPGGGITSLDGNLDSDGTCGFGQANDLSSADPLLNPLTTISHDDVSGNTRVYQPFPGSPIIDSGVVSASNPADDQRGLGRPVDGDGNASSILDRGSFEAVAGVDLTPPVLSEITPVPTPAMDTTPIYTFSTDEAGTITYGGSCSSAATAASVGNNTITFSALTPGVYSNCTITVTDASTNASTPLMVSSFEITAVVQNPNNSGGSGGSGSSGGDCAHITCLSSPETSPQDTLEEAEEVCAGYSDLPSNDPDCTAITYAQSIGAMTGNDDGTFAPTELLQRDQITKISLEAFELFDSNEDYCSGENPFPDVTASDWSHQYVCRGKQLGMITGYESGAEAGMFMPGDRVILVELWALILRNLDVVMPLGPSFNGWLVDAWYSGYARYVAMNDLYEGLPSATELVPRRDVAVFLYELHLLGVL